MKIKKGKKVMKQMADKRPAKLVALDHEKFGRKEGEIFYATKATANNLIKKEFAKKA